MSLLRMWGQHKAQSFKEEALAIGDQAPAF